MVNKKMKVIGVISFIGVMCISVIFILITKGSDESQLPIIIRDFNPYNLTRDDVFISSDFTPLLGKDVFLQVRREHRHADPFQPYRTMLYITHKNADGESHYAMYGFTYGFEHKEDLCDDELEKIRRIYFEYLQELLEAVTVEQLRASTGDVFKDVLYGLRTFIDKQMYTNGVNMYLSVAQTMTLFDRFDEFPALPFSSTVDFVVFNIENGISRPAAVVTVVDDNTILINDEDIVMRFTP